MATNRKRKSRPDQDRSLYLCQNKAIHKARSQLCMELDDCRELAKQISGKASISSLTLRQRWELIEMLKAKGARVYNPPLAKAPVSSQGSHQAASSLPDGCSVRVQENPEDVYPECLTYWNNRFPNRRKGFASNEQLAWIQTLWELDFNDGRRGRGLRGFIFRQTKNLGQGPVSDLAFLRNHHVRAVMGPLKAKAKQRRVVKEAQGNKL